MRDVHADFCMQLIDTIYEARFGMSWIACGVELTELMVFAWCMWHIIPPAELESVNPACSAKPSIPRVYY